MDGQLALGDSLARKQEEEEKKKKSKARPTPIYTKARPGATVILVYAGPASELVTLDGITVNSLLCSYSTRS